MEDVGLAERSGLSEHNRRGNRRDLQLREVTIRQSAKGEGLDRGGMDRLTEGS